MKSRRATHRSFPGRLTLEEWTALPDLGRRDMISRAACEALACHRLCASKQCQRHRTCCADDAIACERRLQKLPRRRTMALQRELGRLDELAKLFGPGGYKGQDIKQPPASVSWTAALSEPWNAPPSPPWEPASQSCETE